MASVRMETLEIGATPVDEECAQLGSPGYYERAQAECRRFIARIVEVLGPAPAGARLRIKGSQHDYGTYYEVAVTFDSEDEAATNYAYLVESSAPATWGDAPQVGEPDYCRICSERGCDGSRHARAASGDEDCRGGAPRP